MTVDFEENILKKAFGSFATGVAVATSHKSGFTINSFASLSLKPPLIIFNIYKSETDHVDFLKNNSFVINFLSNEQEEISRLFATKDAEKVSKTSHTISSSNNIILDNTLGHIELSVYQQIDIADHVLVIGKVEDLKIDDNRNPLIYYRSNYQILKNDQFLKSYHFLKLILNLVPYNYFCLVELYIRFLFHHIFVLNLICLFQGFEAL